jgi:D-glycero-D-manno-heptose 1,7-bisphosphate phosphatase
VRILFLDRDGTLNRSLGRRPPNTPQEVELLPGVATLLSTYAAQGWALVIVSNQGGVASGYISEGEARTVQQQVVDLLPVPVAASYLCPHMPGGSVSEYAIECPNRKPRPGFILAALEQLGAQPEDCLFVGDSVTDRQAAEAAGVVFRWADLFFGRPIDRGLLTRDGRWVQVRHAETSEWEVLGDIAATWGELLPPARAVDQEGNLSLVALLKGVPVGWLNLRASGESEREADLAFGVDPAYQGSLLEATTTPSAGIGSMLLESALDWARAEPSLERLCVQVRADNLPVSRLCCRHGFGERRTPVSGRATEQGWIRLDCSL